MTIIDTTTGQVTLDDFTFPALLREQGKPEPVYQNRSITRYIDGKCCDVTAYYKYRKLQNIHIHLNDAATTAAYKELLHPEPPNQGLFIKLVQYLDHRWNWGFLQRFLPPPSPSESPIETYVNFYTLTSNELADYLCKGTKRKFAWGKITTQTDPRGPHIFLDIKYYRVPSYDEDVPDYTLF